MLVFSVTPYQNKNQNRTIDKVQRRTKGKYTKTQVTAIFFSEICGEMFFPNLKRFVWRRHADDTNMAAGNNQKHLSLSFGTKA